MQFWQYIQRVELVKNSMPTDSVGATGGGDAGIGSGSGQGVLGRGKEAEQVDSSITVPGPLVNGTQARLGQPPLNHQHVAIC